MSFKEKVLPGTVNSLISFFENHPDEPTTTTRNYREDEEQNTSKQEVINNYFSNTNGQQYSHAPQTQAPDSPVTLNGKYNQDHRRSFSDDENSDFVNQTSQQQASEIQISYQTQSSAEDHRKVSDHEQQYVQTETSESVQHHKEEYIRTQTTENVSYELKYEDVDNLNITNNGISENQNENQDEFLDQYEDSAGKVDQQIGFIYPKDENNVKEEKEDLEQGYEIQYELLPNHLKGFTTPTVLPASYTDPESDAESLKKAMKGLGCDEDAIIKVLTDKNTEQRLQIVHEYEALFKKDLIKELQKELSGNFEDTVVALMTPAYEFLASELKRAVKGAGTDEDTLVEILCIYDDKDIEQIKATYQRLFKKTLKDDIYEDTSGDFRKVLLSILAASKQDPKASPSSVASQLCAVDAKGKIALDSDTLRTVMVSYSRPFLYNVFKEYETITEQPFSNLIKKVSSGDARNALTAIYRGIVSLPTFFAEELQAAFKGLGTKDRKLIRIVVSRAEVDLEDIKQAFSDLYGKSLEKEVQKETSGDYKKILLSLLAGCNQEDYKQAPSHQQVPESNL
ncbi:UNVERIFIED_CONTAM: hypothetical protein RMT77_012659 [Armadillidium vulgare]